MRNIGRVPSTYSFTAEDLRFLVRAKIHATELEPGEIETGVIFKGPFIVNHPVYEYFPAVNLTMSNELVSFSDGDKVFEFRPNSEIVICDEELTFTYDRGPSGSGRVRIRAITPSDADFSGKANFTFNRWVEQLSHYMNCDPRSSSCGKDPWVSREYDGQFCYETIRNFDRLLRAPSN